MADPRTFHILKNVVPLRHRDPPDPRDHICAEEVWCCDELRGECTKRNFKLFNQPYSEARFSGRCCVTDLFISTRKLDVDEHVISILR